MLRVSQAFAFKFFDDDGRECEDRYSEGSLWMTTAFEQDYRQLTECKVRDGKMLISNRVRWIPEDMLSQFEEAGNEVPEVS